MTQSQTDTRVPVYMAQKTNQNLSPIYATYANTDISPFHFESDYTNYTNSPSSQPFIQSEPIPEGQVTHTQHSRIFQGLFVLMLFIFAGSIVGFFVLKK